MSKKKQTEKTNNDNVEAAHDAPERTALIEYPCDFVIKMMGKNNEEFIAKAKELILAHFPAQKETITFKEVPSKDGNYLAISAKIVAENQEELDKCYHALTAEPLVLIAL